MCSELFVYYKTIRLIHEQAFNLIGFGRCIWILREIIIHKFKKNKKYYIRNIIWVEMTSEGAFEGFATKVFDGENLIVIFISYWMWYHGNIILWQKWNAVQILFIPVIPHHKKIDNIHIENILKRWKILISILN